MEFFYIFNVTNISGWVAWNDTVREEIPAEEIIAELKIFV